MIVHLLYPLQQCTTCSTSHEHGVAYADKSSVLQIAALLVFHVHLRACCRFHVESHLVLLAQHM